MHRVIIHKDICTGKKACIPVCDANVLGWAKAQDVSFTIKMKLMMESKGYQAYVANEAACTACMRCVQVCPEGAIEVIPENQ